MKRDCEHGSLALSCEMCDLEDFLDEVQEAWTRAEAENARLRAERTAMLDALEAGQALADLDTWSWEDRQSAVGEWDQRIARVRDVQRRTTVREPTDITGGHMGADRRRP